MDKSSPEVTHMPEVLSEAKCHLCGSNQTRLFPEYSSFFRVTSDCRPWIPGGKLLLCRSCGCAQTLTDSAWSEETRQVYSEYALYHQSEGREQEVLDGSTGVLSARSGVLLEKLATFCALPSKGRLVDVGCGKGHWLSEFRTRFPDWRLNGDDMREENRRSVEAIPGVEGFHTCSPREIPGEFDLISLIHCLEHIPQPKQILEEINSKLTTGGRLLVQVPDCEVNPFTLLIADHCTHFYVQTLARLAVNCGFTVEHAANDWITKELTLVATRSRPGGKTLPPLKTQDWENHIQQQLAWLKNVKQAAVRCSARGNFGIFGSAIAATWLDTELKQAARFFVDEDPHRIGKQHLQRPIISPREIPAGSNVFVALPPALSRKIAQRIARPEFQVVLPEP